MSSCADFPNDIRVTAIYKMQNNIFVSFLLFKIFNKMYCQDMKGPVFVLHQINVIKCE